jgi:hypothetical protein
VQTVAVAVDAVAVGGRNGMEVPWGSEAYRPSCREDRWVVGVLRVACVVAVAYAEAVACVMVATCVVVAACVGLAFHAAGTERAYSGAGRALAEGANSNREHHRPPQTTSQARNHGKHQSE